MELPCAACGKLVYPVPVYEPDEDGHPQWILDQCPVCRGEI